MWTPRALCASMPLFAMWTATAAHTMRSKLLAMWARFALNALSPQSSMRAAIARLTFMPRFPMFTTTASGTMIRQLAMWTAGAFGT
eukprot:4932257-Amphidinium_carterae.1